MSQIISSFKNLVIWQKGNMMLKIILLILPLAAIAGCGGGKPVVDVTSQEVFEDTLHIGDGVSQTYGFSSFSFANVEFENGLTEIEGEVVEGTVLLSGTVQQLIELPNGGTDWQTSPFSVRGGIVTTGNADPDERMYRAVAETVNASGFGWGRNEDAFRAMLDGWLNGRESFLKSQNGQLQGTTAFIRADIHLLATGQ